MDLTNFKSRDYLEGVDYALSFWFSDHIGTWGYCFTCDKEGTLAPFNCPEAEQNYKSCLTGEVNGHKVMPGEIVERSWRRHVPAEGVCPCGERIILSGFTNTCECGRDYNSSGQVLAPREQWGAETSEYLSDILRIP